MKTNNKLFQSSCYYWIKLVCLLAALSAAACYSSRSSSRQNDPLLNNNASTRIRGAAGGASSNRNNNINNINQHKTTPRFLQEADEACTESCCLDQYMDTLCPEEDDSSNPFGKLPAAVQFIMMALLICFSAMFSGLTLGLMGLDITGLEIVMHGDDPVNAAYAKKIYPLRKRGNLLLCTLLLGNTAVNSLLSILLADWAGGALGVVISTFLILIFGEITPQAACSRYALWIGSRTVPIVRVIMILLFPVTYPLSWILDRVLGKELATTYSNAEMLKLLQIHVEENAMDPDTATAMTGALKYKEMAVRDVMTPLSNVFMLKADEKLSFETIAKIFKTGYSRIPVYEISKNNVIGLIFVKDLIFIDPEDETRVGDLMDIFGRGVHVVWPDDKLGDVLRELKQGRSHMALVRDVNNEDESQDPFYEVTGIITLEDIIEEILGSEIVDETDAFVDKTHSIRLDREDAFKFARLRLLDRKIVDERLSIDETRAVTAHLWKNFPQVVSLLTEKQLQRLVAETTVTVLPTAEQEVGEIIPSDLLYEKGKATDFCTLILAGKVTVLVGADQFRSDVSSWALLASGALEDSNYIPDFTAFVSSGPCRCIRISRTRYTAAADASAFERTQHSSIHSSQHNGTEAGVASLTYSETRHPPAPDVGVVAHQEGSELLERTDSRKAKLMTALRAVEKDIEPQQKMGAKSSSGSKVMFIDSEDLSESARMHMQKAASKHKNKPSPEPSTLSPESKRSRFEFIGTSVAPDAVKLDAADDETS